MSVGNGGSGNGDGLLVDVSLRGNLDIDVGLSGDLLMGVSLGRDLLVDVGLSGDLLVDVGLSLDLSINVSLSGDVLVDVGLSSGVEVGVGDRWVVGGSINSSVDSGEGSVSVGNRGSWEGGSVVGQSLSSI